MSTSVFSSLSRRIINGRVISQTLKSTSSVTLPSLPIAITNHNDMKNGGGKRFFTSNVKLQQSDDSVATVSYPMKTAEIGMKAPGFTAPAVIDGEIKELSLQDYQGQYVVLLFYPKDFTFVCPTEIIAFNDRIKDFEKVNTKLIAISTDTENSHLAWTRVPRKAGGLGPMQIPLVADVKKTIASQYGTLSEAAGFAFRGLFIIDGAGNLQQSTINNFPVGRSVDETLRLIQAFQFVEKHGEVCPANWQPGDDTIVPDPEDSLKFFSNVKDPVSHKTTSIQQIKNENELNKVLKSNEKVVVDFMASWCSKCQQIAPFVEELSKKKSNVKFVQIDTSLAELKSLKEKYNVSALPTFKFFKNGNPVGTEVTGYKKQLLSETVSKLFH